VVFTQPRGEPATLAIPIGCSHSLRFSGIDAHLQHAVQPVLSLALVLLVKQLTDVLANGAVAQLGSALFNELPGSPG
jgi:hypothetical protein